MQNSELNRTQIRKGLIITVLFVLLRLIMARLWQMWFGGDYHLTLPFLLFLLAVFLVMSVGLVYVGFSQWVGVDLRAWWFKRDQIVSDILWGIGALVGLGILVLGAGIVMWTLDLMPASLEPTQEATSLSQIPINLILGWVFGFAIASFEEETIFRGFLQEVLDTKYGAWGSNLLQAAIFSAAHLGMEPITSLGSVTSLLLFRFVLGVVFGWLRMKRGTLLAAGVLHGIIG